MLKSVSFDKQFSRGDGQLPQIYSDDVATCEMKKERFICCVN